MSWKSFLSTAFGGNWSSFDQDLKLCPSQLNLSKNWLRNFLQGRDRELWYLGERATRERRQPHELVIPKVTFDERISRRTPQSQAKSQFLPARGSMATNRPKRCPVRSRYFILHPPHDIGSTQFVQNKTTALDRRRRLTY